MMFSVIFIILNLVLAGAVVFFVRNSAGNAQVWEEVYAKQISSLINRASPGTTILLNVEEGAEIFAEKRFDDKLENVLDKPELNELVQIDNEENSVLVKVGEKGGHKAYYFSNYYVESSLQNDVYLTINVMDEVENG